MKTYKVPVVWQMYGYVEVKAKSMSDAIYEASGVALPTDAEYLEGSFEVDTDGIEEVE